MNNALRRLGQQYDASWLERLGGRVDGRRVLEVGCGRGVGVQIILERFGAASVEAIDLDPKMVECARRRLAAYDPTRVQLSVGGSHFHSGWRCDVRCCFRLWGNSLGARLAERHR